VLDLLPSLYLMQIYMSVPYCMTVPNSSGWNSILTSCPLCLFEEFLLCVQYKLFYVLVLFCWTVKSDGNCQLIPPVHKVRFLSFSLFLDWFCSVILWSLTILVHTGQGRQAMSSNHSSSIKQFHTSVETSVTCLLLSL
jgi:hypothetical protein